MNIQIRRGERAKHLPMMPLAISQSLTLMLVLIRMGTAGPTLFLPTGPHHYRLQHLLRWARIPAMVAREHMQALVHMPMSGVQGKSGNA